MHGCVKASQFFVFDCLNFSFNYKTFHNNKGEYRNLFIQTNENT